MTTACGPCGCDCGLRKLVARARSKAPAALAGLLGAIGAVSGWLRDNDVKFALIGGVAASLHGTPRLTKDVDVVAMVEDAAWSALLKQAVRWKLQPRTSDALEFAKITRVLLLIHTPSRIEVDLSLGMLPFEAELVDRASTRQVKGVRFPLATPEDIIIMKALALRPRDVVDIEGIVAAIPTLDLTRVRRIVSQLSASLETHDHLARLEAILQHVMGGASKRPR